VSQDSPQSPINQAHLIRVLAPVEPIVGIALPPAVANALSIPAELRLAREEWGTWIDTLGTAKTVLMWIPARMDDDQAYLRAIGAKLDAEARLFTFHAMSVLTSDRLTGDAVLQLLTDAGLDDAGCVNGGFGYYARRFVRRPEGVEPKPLPVDDLEAEAELQADPEA